MSICRIMLAFERIVFLAAVLVLTGCLGSPFEPRTYDVTSDPAWWGDLHLHEMLELNQDALLNGRALELAAYKNTPTYDSQAIFGRTITVEMLKANPRKYWDDLQLLPKGTRFRCVKLERCFSDQGSDYRISAEILNGVCKGHIAYIDPLWGDPDKKGSLKLSPHSLVHPVRE